VLCGTGSSLGPEKKREDPQIAQIAADSGGARGGRWSISTQGRKGARAQRRKNPTTRTTPAKSAKIRVVFDFAPEEWQQRLPEPLVLRVLPLAPDRLDTVVSPTRLPHQPINCSVALRDAFDNRIPVDNREIFLTCGDVTKSVHLANGRATAELTPADASVACVEAMDPISKMSAVSNPSVTMEDLTLFVGDLHCHDFLSEAEQYPDELYRWAREDRAFDFVSVVPQTHGWLDNETWTIAKYMAERHLDEGRFVTFLGFEWQHTGYADKTVHFLGGDQPYLPVDSPSWCSAAHLHEALRAADALVISHHSSYPPGSWCSHTDFTTVDDDVERLVELWSMHGSSEGYNPDDRPLPGRDPDSTAMAALRRGLRLGFVAGSDTHSGRPGGSAKEPRNHWGGMTGVWARDLTRRSLFEALQARRTVALTKARIILQMNVNDMPMGSELPAADRVRIRIDVWAPGQITSVELIKNTELRQRWEPRADECHAELEDRPRGPVHYHCRVTLQDGNLAVCSPVWVG